MSARVLVLPQSDTASESKLALILKTLGCRIVHAGGAELSIWHSDLECEQEKWINHRSIAINKARVSSVFGDIFGYPILVNPETHQGPCVEKQLDHGTHGTVVVCPSQWRPSRCYQRLITNNPTQPWLEEWRLDIFDKDILATLKRLDKGPHGFPLASRRNASFEFNVDIQYEFSPRERTNIFTFCHAIGLQYGSLDALRDLDGRLYIIDATVNTAPPTMSWHKNTTMEKYLAVSAEFFHNAFLAR